MTCRSRTPEFCRKSRQPQAYCCVQPSRGRQQADLHSEGLRKRAKNILSRFASLFITQWVQSVTSHIYTPQQVAGYSFHKTLMQTFTLSTNKHPQWSSGDRFGPAQPCRANRTTWQGLCWSDRVSGPSGTWQGERKQSNDWCEIGSAFSLMSCRPGHGFRRPADGQSSVSGKPSRKRSSLAAISCFGLGKNTCSTSAPRGCCILSSYL